MLYKVNFRLSFPSDYEYRIGRRPYMEDVDISHTNVKITEASVVSIFGVFDGHGGKFAK